MTRVAVLLVTALVATACGAASTAKGVPDVRGMDAPAAAARLLKAHYCVELKNGPASSAQTGGTAQQQAKAQVPVLRQSPAPGATPRAWSLVTLTISLPSQTPKAVYGIDIAGAGSARCPRIQTSA